MESTVAVIASKAWAALALAAMLAMGPPARAGEWLRVETDRFVVFGEGDARPIRAFAARLATYDAVLRRLHKGASRRSPPPQKLEIYLVHGHAEMVRIRPGIAPTVAGFYSASPYGLFAVADLDNEAGADAALFHEYAHHFMLETFPAAYPAWFVEGCAEYFMTMEIAHRQVVLGRANRDRAAWLDGADWLPMADVLNRPPSAYDGPQVALWYAQSWLLTHYMRATPARAAGMDRALAAIGAGGDPVQAMTDATGMDIAALTQALHAYRQRPTQTLPNPFPMPPPMTVTPMPASTDLFLLDGLRLTGVGVADDPAFLADLRRRAAPLAGDQLADLTLARAEMFMGDVVAGEAIVARRLAADADEVPALRAVAVQLIQRGDENPPRREVLFRRAAAYAARGASLAPGDYRLLYSVVYGRSVEPDFPTRGDARRLRAAHALAPSVDEVSLLLGQVLLSQGDRAEALGVLQHLANTPHGGPMSDRARELIAGHGKHAKPAR